MPLPSTKPSAKTNPVVPAPGKPETQQPKVPVPEPPKELRKPVSDKT